ncbi:MAG: hypothetical protein EBR00_08200, partial [Gammaproteobacteria bacterium]|nr:hypothetical protein [Gammaproteobacteria bacterium]
MAASLAWLIEQQLTDSERVFFTVSGKWVAWVVLVMPWIVGAGLVGMEWTESQGQGRDIAVVQGAIPQDQKWLL